MTCPESQITDDFKTQFGNNHLIHFLPFHLLKPVLLALSIFDCNLYIIIILSSTYYFGSICFNNLSMQGKYNLYKIYR